MANMIVQVGRDRYRCRYCGKMLRKDEVENHKDLHTNPYICSVCGKHFSKKIVLEDHVRNIHIRGGNRPRCPICFKRFSGKIALIKHQRKEHPPARTVIVIRRNRQGSRRSYRCDACNTEFPRMASLKKSQRV